MPSINRPNVPDRLPSGDFEDLFYKPRSLLAAEARISVGTPSPRTQLANPFAHRRALHASESGIQKPAAPMVSPPLTGPAPRRPLYLDLSAYRSERLSDQWSESSATSESLGSGVNPRSSDNRNVIEQEPTPLRHRTSSSTASNVSSKAHKLLGASESLGHPASPNAQPPREARKGFKWKRDFLGGWFEIRVGRQKETEEPPRVEPPEPVLPLWENELAHHIASSTVSADSAAQQSREPLISETPTSDNVSVIGPLQEGLYCRTKRALGLKHGPISPYAQAHSTAHSRTPTGNILDQVASTLRHIPPRASFASAATASTSNLSIAGPYKPRRRGLLQSNSSSVRDLLMGKPPISTPEPEAMYTGSNSRQYLTVDLTQSDAPTFLPSEARRVHTPPLPNAKSANKAPLRGFFFDYNAPPFEGRESAELPKSSSSSTLASSTLGDPPPERDWYRKQLDLIDEPGPAFTTAIESELPDHFPTSPLCPRNPKHKSGGLGTCPYHGRNKSTPSDAEAEKTPTREKGGSLSPVLETWWCT